MCQSCRASRRSLLARGLTLCQHTPFHILLCTITVRPCPHWQVLHVLWREGFYCFKHEVVMKGFCTCSMIDHGGSRNVRGRSLCLHGADAAVI